MKQTHPVKRELWRLLGGVALCTLLVLAAYLLMSAQLDRLRRTQEEFHALALSMCAELSSTLASMTSPQGMTSGAFERFDDEAAFVAGVTRDFGRAQATLGALLALHRKESAPEFARTVARLARASDELKTLERLHRGEPLALARIVNLQPLYATVVVQQTQRLHEQASLHLRARQALAERVFVATFALVCAALGLALVFQLRRSLRGIDEILAQEQRARERAVAVLAAVPDLWFVLDEKGCFLEVSDAAHRDLQGSWDTLKGRPLELVPAPTDPTVAAPLLSPSQRRLQALEYEVAADRGGPRAFEARLVPTSGDHWLYLSRDISERKRAELALTRSKGELERQVAIRTQQLTIARDAAENANRAKSDFLSRMSHELRTPMNAVLGFAQLMGLDPAASQQQRQSLDHILRAGKHLLHLINDVLDLAHVESGRLTLSPEPIGVQDLVHEVAALMNPLAQTHRVRIELAPMAGSVVRADRLRIKQVLLNLCANAVKYNRPGGWVRISTESRAESRLCIVVEDSGQGISAEGLSKLFEPFSRLGAEGGAVEGTGIGLSISQRLAELMDGRIGAQSTLGQGSRFWIELPSDQLLPSATAGTTQPGSLASDAGARAAQVLYVEDNPDNMELLVGIVDRHPNVKLIAAPSAALGLDLARAHRPDLVLLDLHLPDSTGYGLLQRLRNHEETRAIPVVAVTANAMPTEEARALEAGFAAFLTKPIDVRRFDGMLRQMLGREP
ncbi:MAG TPA: ATP-binding protein [Burkholderiaceae bacterium]|nr:ATP-binding protein [Burkholderiaceae bacterium]